jgi:hypothetical protein
VTNGNGNINPTTNPLQAEGLNLVINWNPSTGQVKVAFPQVDHLMIFGMIEFAKVSLLEMRAKAEQRVTIPDMQVTKRLIT